VSELGFPESVEGLLRSWGMAPARTRTPCTTTPLRWRDMAPGVVLIGTLRAHDARAFAAFDTPAGPVTVTCPAVLDNALADLAIGTKVRVTYRWFARSRSGRTYCAFDVDVGPDVDARDPFADGGPR